MRKNNKRSKTLTTTHTDMQNMLSQENNNETNTQNQTDQQHSRNESTNFFDSRGFSSELLSKTKIKFFNNETNPYSKTKKSATSSYLPKINSNASSMQKPNKANIILIKNNQNQSMINKNGFRMSSDAVLKRKINENASSQTKNINQVNLLQKQSQLIKSNNNNNSIHDNHVIQRRNKKMATTQLISRNNTKQIVVVLNPHSPLKNGHVFIKNRSSADILESSRKHLLSGEKIHNNNSEKDIHKKRAKAYQKEYGKDVECLPSKNAAISQRGLDENRQLKQNQDSYVLIENIFGLVNFSIFGVFDGHGSNGHLVSQFIKRRAEEYFSKQTTYSQKPHKTFTHEKILHCLKKNNYEIITKFNEIVHNELEQDKIDINFSGSTCVIVFRVCDTLIVSNCGDSRAILIKEKSKHRSHSKYHYSAIQLSIDHKPELPLEKERIENSGGAISRYKEDNGEFDGPMRVWVKGKDYPGIATSRSIGDSIAKKVGVVYEPDIEMYDIDEHVKYLVVASDGVWEFLTNKDVMKIIKPYFKSGDVEGACDEVVNKSIEKWEKEEYGRDDITVVVSFLGNPTKKKGDIQVNKLN